MKILSRVKDEVMPSNSFFNEQKEQSLVKSTVVAKYFEVWAKIMIDVQKRNSKRPPRIGYIDLFAGPGRYKDGTQSTPIMLLSKTVSNPDLRESLVTLFNDKDLSSAQNLKNTISQIPGIKTLKHKPQVYSQEIGEKSIENFLEVSLIPCLLFVDPWGYKGFSLRLVNSVLKDWGCDAIFFFNYNRVNMGVSNEAVKESMEALFGESRLPILREKLLGKKVAQREAVIIEELCSALKEYGAEYVLPFTFKNDSGKRTSHHLIFASKHARGYGIMKEIMARESTSHVQGVPSFEYNSADFLPQESLLFQLKQPLSALKNDLLVKFNGQTVTMLKIFDKHNKDTPYIKKNYKDVLRELYESGSIDAISPKGKPPRKNSFADEIIVTFPDRR